jgi:hypothetical protein
VLVLIGSHLSGLTSRVSIRFPCFFFATSDEQKVPLFFDMEGKDDLFPTVYAMW